MGADRPASTIQRRVVDASPGRVFGRGRCGVRLRPEPLWPLPGPSPGVMARSTLSLFVSISGVSWARRSLVCSSARRAVDGFRCSLPARGWRGEWRVGRPRVVDCRCGPVALVDRLPAIFGCVSDLVCVRARGIPRARRTSVALWMRRAVTLDLVVGALRRCGAASVRDPVSGFGSAGRCLSPPVERAWDFGASGPTVRSQPRPVSGRPAGDLVFARWRVGFASCWRRGRSARRWWRRHAAGRCRLRTGSASRCSAGRAPEPCRDRCRSASR